jgi:hypothetical protein
MEAIINYNEAVSRLGGNKHLYLKIAKKYIDDYSNIPEEIALKIHEYNYKGASILAHTLRGISGSLGASGLQEICRVLEQRLNDKTVDGDFENLIDEFKLEFTRVHNEIKNFL